MSCKVIFKGKESLLFNKLSDIVKDENEANILYNYFKSDEFKNEFGDYETDHNSELKTIEANRLDDNGEPALFKDNKGNTYYIDKYGEKIFYPYNKNNLNSIFTYVESQELTKLLALDFVQRAGFNLNFNELELNSKNNITLKRSIEAKLNEKIIEFNNRSASQWKRKAASLELVKDNHVDELTNSVINYFRELKLVYNENLENTEEEEFTAEENEERGQQFGVASFERSTKENITSNVKLRLSLIPDVTKTDYIFNDVVFIPFNEIYSDLLKVLTNKTALVKGTNQEDIFNIYLNEIDNLAKRKPHFKELYNILTHPAITDNLKSEFVQAFNLDRNNFISSEIVEKVDSEIVAKYDENGNVISYETESTEPKFNHTVMNVSNSGAKQGSIINQWGINFKKKFVNSENLIAFEQKQNIKAIIDSLKEGNNNKLSFDERVNNLVDNLRKIGVETTEKGFNYYLDGLQLTSQDNNVKNEILNQSVNNIVILLNNLNTGKLAVGNKSGYINPLTDQSVIKNMSIAEAFYLNEGSDASIFTSGKNKWLYSYPSYLSSKLKEWKQDRNLLLQHYNSSPYNQGSALMRWLLALDEDLFETRREEISIQRINDLELLIFNNFQEESNSKEGVDNKSISKNDYFVDFINKTLAFKKGAKSYNRSVTPADKGTQYEFYTGFNIDTNARYENGKVIINDNAVEIVYNYFKSEYDRMRQARTEVQIKPENELVTHYHLGSKNAFKSQLFPLLSSNKISQEMDAKVSNDMRFDTIYNPDGTPSLENLDVVKDKIKSYIASELSDEIISTHTTLRNSEIFTLNDKGKYDIKGIDIQILDNYEGQKTIKIAADIFINGLISQVEYSKLFAGDVAYYKNIVDYKKRIPATYTDGLQLRLNNENNKFNIAVISSIEIASPFINKLTEYLPPNISKYYKKINAADAQAWITPQRWKVLLQGMGKYDALAETIYNKITSGNEEIYTEKELKKMAQPLKGVYFEINNGVPTYLKYSQAVLIPNLIKDSDLERIYNKMVNQNVDELITIDGVKVGAPKITTIHDKNGLLKDDFEFNVKQIKSSGWKLQQDLPVKGFKQTQVGSQIQKNIYQGLASNLDEMFFFNEEETTGLEIIRMIDETIGKLSDFGREAIQKEFGLDENYRINDISKFYNTMIEELKSRGGSQNLIEALEAGTSLYGIPQAHSKLMNIFASILNSRMVKIKTNGGAFIQMSNFGLNKSEAESQGVIWSPTALETTHEPYIYEEDGRKKVRPGGILISGSFIAKYIPNYRNIPSDELFNEVIDKKILENIIGYRIPNQGLSSNDALEIVGILPETSGDTVVAYTGITTKTGSDFDIDKMYMMFPNYKLSDGKLKYIDSEEDNKEAVQNRLIELYKSVLTNPNNIVEIMTPIDFEFMKNDIVDLFPKISGANLEVFNPVEDINIKYEFSAGKAGVGQEANALVDHVRGTMANLRFLSDIKWGNLIDDYNKLDEIFSEEISDEDLNYYLKDYNKDKPENLQLSEQDIKGLKKIKISNSLSAILNAFVDIAKDPYITRGNWVTQTTNTGNLMLRMGIHPLYVNSFIGQPIIKQYVEFSSNKESIVNNNSGDMKTKFKFKLVNDLLKDKKLTVNGTTKNYDIIYNSLVRNSPNYETYKETGIDTSLAKFTSKEILALFKTNAENLSQTEKNDLNEMFLFVKEAHKSTFFPKKIKLQDKPLKSFRDQIKKKSSPEFQLAVLDTFYSLQEMSKYVRINNDASKLDVNGMGKNITTLFIAQNTIDYLNYIELKEPSALKGFDTKLINPNTGEATLLGNYKKNIIDYSIELVQANPKLFFTANEAVQRTFNVVSLDVQNSLLLDETLGTTLEGEFYSYLLSGFKPFNTTNEEKSDLLNNLPLELQQFKKDHGDEYLIVDELEIKLGEKNINYIGLNNRKKSNEFEYTLVNSWRDLLNDYPEFANKLIQYSYLTSGFRNNNSQFFTYIPSEWFVENKINSYIISKSREYENFELDENFLNQLYRHNLENRQLVPNVFENNVQFSLNGQLMTIKKPGKGRYYVAFSSQQGENTVTKYYRLDGYNNKDQAIYVLTEGIGSKDKKGNRIYEYNIDGPVRTIVKSQMLKQEILPTVSPSVQSRDLFHDMAQLDYKPNVGEWLNYNISEEEWLNLTEEERSKIKECN